MLIVDPFEKLVTDAKDKLSEREGREVSWRELARRCGYDDGREWGVFRNAIRPQRDRRADGQRAEGRRPNPEVVRRLATVLPVSEEELNVAAAQTAGYSITGFVQTGKSYSFAHVLHLVQEYLDDEDVSKEEREERAARVVTVIADRAPLALEHAQHQQLEETAPTAGEVVEFPRRRYLTEVGAAAREGEPKQDLSDEDGNVD